MKIENLDVEVGQSVRVYMAGHKFKQGKKKKGKPLYFKGTVKVYGKSKYDKRFKDGFVILYGHIELKNLNPLSFEFLGLT